MLKFYCIEAERGSLCFSCLICHSREPIYPKTDRRIAWTREINESVRIWRNFHKYKNDMKTMAFAMGPGGFSIY